MKRYIVILLCLLQNAGFAQSSFQEVDSTSYSLYSLCDWDALSRYGQQAASNKFDYYYLNLRTGIAFFELQNFQTAMIYFERALKNNSASLVAQEYLFWCHYNLNDEITAYQFYKILPDSVRERMPYKSSKPVDFIIAEGGMKLSDKTEAAKNMTYLNVDLQHKFSPFLDVYQGFMYFQQDAIWGNMRQNQYMIMPGVNLKNGWRVSLALNLANYQSHLDYHDQISWRTHHNVPTSGGMTIVDTAFLDRYSFTGIYKENALLSQLNVSRKKGNFTMTPHFSLYTLWMNPNYMETRNQENQIFIGHPPNPPTYSSTAFKQDTIRHDQKDAFIRTQTGIDLSYAFGGKYTIGSDFNYLSGLDSSRFNWSPYFRFQITKKFTLGGFFAKKGNYVLALNNGLNFLNSYDQDKKMSFTAGFAVSKMFTLYLTYQYEQVTDNLSMRDYSFNSMFIGLKCKL